MGLEVDLEIIASSFSSGFELTMTKALFSYASGFYNLNKTVSISGKWKANVCELGLKLNQILSLSIRRDIRF